LIGARKPDLMAAEIERLRAALNPPPTRSPDTDR